MNDLPFFPPRDWLNVWRTLNKYMLDLIGCGCQTAGGREISFTCQVVLLFLGFWGSSFPYQNYKKETHCMRLQKWCCTGKITLCRVK